MTRARNTRGRKKKRNPGWFKKGHDARRSTYRFTPQDCRVGWLVANIKHPHLREWLRMRLWVYYSSKRKEGNGQEESGVAAGPAGDDIPF